MANNFTNPWGKGGKYWAPKSVEPSSTSSKPGGPIFDKLFGGEVTNSTDIPWLISGASNSKAKDFHLLPSNTNSDDLDWVSKQLNSDVDAVWPAGNELNYKDSNGKLHSVTSGAFKLRDLQNTNIITDDEGNYIIYDFYAYYTNNNLPAGWSLP